MNADELSPTTRNVLALSKDIPLILLKKNPGSVRADRVFKELLAISEKDLIVCENDQGIVLFRRSQARQFLV